MSSGFVSGGTVDAPIERDEAWLAAQQEVEANHRRKAELARQNDGKSLFETLEANKAAKQEAFEEAAKLKHQFQSLNDDEVEYLDSILERTRAEEARVKKETQEGLDLFRRQQEEADKKSRGSDKAVESVVPTAEDSWAAGRKRKRAKDKEGLKGVKVRRSSRATEDVRHSTTINTAVATNQAEVKHGADASKDLTKSQEKKTVASKNSLGLVDYGSDDED